MHWNQAIWTIVKDIVLTGTGVGVIISQVFSMKPSEYLLITALALTVPSVLTHSGAILGLRIGSQSSPPSSPDGSSQSGSGQGGSGK